MPPFSIVKGIHKWNTCLYTPLSCAEHYLACTAQPKGHTEIGPVEYWNIVQMKVLHQAHKM